MSVVEIPVIFGSRLSLMSNEKELKSSRKVTSKKPSQLLLRYFASQGVKMTLLV